MSKRALTGVVESAAKKARTDASPVKQGSLDGFVRTSKPAASTSSPIASTSKAVALPPVDIPAFRSSLSSAGDPSDADLLALELDTIDPSWLPALLPTIRSSQYKQLKRFLWQQGYRGSADVQKTIFPPAADVFSWSRYTPLSTVRCVILGQDPYHGPGQAHGLCFSVRPGVKVSEPAHHAALKNIYKELQTDFPGFKPPSHGFLGSWARNGVLLLNSSLTVKSGEAQSHANKGWEALTSAVVDAVAKHSPGAVWLAWGLPAQKRIAKLDTRKHLVLKSAHPSPLSASRGFFGNGHFVKANAWLREKYGDAGPIDWTRLDEVEPDAPNAAPLPGAAIASTSGTSVA